jgi:hypothetical protein
MLPWHTALDKTGFVYLPIPPWLVSPAVILGAAGLLLALVWTWKGSVSD